MLVSAEQAERWAAKFETLDRRKVFELLDSSIALNAPKWTARRRNAEDLLQLVQLPHDLPQLFDGRVKALSITLRLGGWVNEWAQSKGGQISHPALSVARSA